MCWSILCWDYLLNIANLRFCYRNEQCETYHHDPWPAMNTIQDTCYLPDLQTLERIYSTSLLCLLQT